MLRFLKKAVIKGHIFSTGEDVNAVVVQWFQQQPLIDVAMGSEPQHSWELFQEPLLFCP
jgi:hypothetical protein